MNESIPVHHDEVCRRSFLGGSVASLGAMALTSLGARGQSARPLHLPKATAKRVIMIFTAGGMSHIDMWDEKPILNERRGEDLPPSIRNGKLSTAFSEKQGAQPVVGAPYPFRRFGKCGRNITSLLPHIGAHADEFTLIRSMQTDHLLHETAMTTLFTGTPLLGRPSWGSWVSYALGSANKDLPEFVVMLSSPELMTPLQARLWHSGFLPGKHQGVTFRGLGDPVLYVSSPPGVDKNTRRRVLDTVKALDEMQSATSHDPTIDARIKAYEMAARMQTSVPELADLKSEPESVLKRYGAQPGKASFANNCLMARRLAERGTRFIQLCDGAWDLHSRLPARLPGKAREIDQPVGALLQDLKDRGLLDDTVVMLLGEFGRTPFAEGGLTRNDFGRDHNGKVASAMVCGGGFQRGIAYGKSDDWGWDVVADAVQVHDLQATVLHCLGLDHEKLTVRHQGRDHRLTDVHGRVVREILA